MAKAKIIQGPAPVNGIYHGTTANTGLSQRRSLEEVIVNLSTALGIKVIHRVETNRNSLIYEAPGLPLGSYQSATNIILVLAREVARRASEADKARRAEKKAAKAMTP